MTIFTEEFIESLNSDPKIALHQICNLYSSNATFSNSKDINFHLEFFAITEALINHHNLKIILPDISSGDTRSKISQIIDFAQHTANSLSSYVDEKGELCELDKFRKQFATKFGDAFVFEFTDGDIARIKSLLNELRELISSSADFEETHKLRLLNRLEKLQSELHKKMADLDHFWGLVGDAGIVLGKFGKDSMPIVDRIKEITKITWRTQSRAEELPSDTPSPALITFENDV